MYSLIVSSLRYYWRTHLGVLAGAMLTSAVLTGALLVGDSVDGSLRSFAMMRLGDIEHVISTRSQFFNQALATQLDVEIDAHATSMLHLRGMAINQGSSQESGRVQVNQVEVLGVDSGFWQFTDGVELELGSNEVALNEKLAAALHVAVGEEISMRVAKPSLMSRDAPLSWSSDERSKRRRYKVKKILLDTELGRFSLAPSQIGPYNAFVDRTWLQEQVELEGRANLLLVGTGASTVEIGTALKKNWNPEHIGIKVFARNNLIQLESDRIYLDAETIRAALTIADAKPTLTYLVNSIAHGDISTPYSFVVGGPVPETMSKNEIVINRWLADQLDAKVGTEVEIDYAELLPSGDFINRQRSFAIHSIVEMSDLLIERDLMPTYPGLSDVESCADWDVGMPMDDEILKDEANEEYWDSYGQTPKAFVTLAAAQEM